MSGAVQNHTITEDHSEWINVSPTNGRSVRLSREELETLSQTAIQTLQQWLKEPWVKRLMIRLQELDCKGELLCEKRLRYGFGITSEGFALIDRSHDSEINQQNFIPLEIGSNSTGNQYYSSVTIEGTGFLNVLLQIIKQSSPEHTRRVSPHIYYLALEDFNFTNLAEAIKECAKKHGVIVNTELKIDSRLNNPANDLPRFEDQNVSSTEFNNSFSRCPITLAKTGASKVNPFLLGVNPRLQLVKPCDSILREYQVIDETHQELDWRCIGGMSTLAHQRMFIGDKGFIRSIACSAGVLNQPAWFSYYNANNPNSPKVYKFSPVYEVIDNFPYSDVQDALLLDDNAVFAFPGLTISTHKSLGIRILHSTHYGIHVSDPSHFMTMEEFRNRLIGSLSQESYLISSAPDPRSNYNIDQLLDFIFDSEETTYLKPIADTAVGYHVLRISKLNNRVYIEADHIDTSKKLQSMVRSKAELPKVSSLTKVFDAYLIKFAKNEKYYNLETTPETARNIIKELVSDEIGWIAEREIKGEMLERKKIEYRLVFKRLDPTGRLQLISHYAKVSNNKVAGNVALGAKGNDALSTIIDIFRKRRSDLPDYQCRILAKEAIDDLFDCAEHFLERFYQELGSTIGQQLASLPIGAQIDLISYAFGAGVDVIPVWDDTKNKLRWYLMEVQGIANLGTKGILDIDTFRYSWNRNVQSHIGHFRA